MKTAFITKKFRSESLERLDICNTIIADYMRQGFRLTLRQLYYQLVSRDLIPNTERSYKNLGNLINDGRLAGQVDWDAIEDRLRMPYRISEWTDPGQIMNIVADSYRLPRWNNQEYYVELWCEKDALAGVLRPIADQFQVTMMVNRGYSSQSAMKSAADRMLQALGTAQQCVILYIGDLDPSGEDMVRDIKDRLELMAGYVRVQKLAITPEQVAQYNPPPNPAKMTDSRATGFVEKFGRFSYEADALPPNILAQVIRDAIEVYRDEVAWTEVETQEEEDKVLLREARDIIMDKRSGNGA